MLTYTGQLYQAFNTRQVSDKFKTREFVLTDNSSQYPQRIMFQLTQDRCSLIDSAKIGDEITVHFQLRGREWKNPQGEVKYFNALDVWKLETARQYSEPIADVPAPADLTPTEMDNLPF